MASWLEDFIGDALARQLCTKPGCTTCGATEFRHGVIRAAGYEPGQSASAPMGRKAAAAIAAELAKLKGKPQDEDYLAAVRLLIVDLAQCLPEDELQAALAGSWAGTVLTDMEGHAASRRQREEYLATAPERRAAKRALKQEQHAERLAAKAQREHLWRERQTRSTPSSDD
jgi:hypothetical protein